MIPADAVVWAVGAVAVVEDLRSRRIPNWLIASGIAAGLLCGGARAGWPGLGMASAGAATGFVLFLVFYLLGGMGAGDIKLLAAFGALLGPAEIFTAAVLAAAAGGLLALASLFRSRRAGTIPYAPAIVAGVWLAVLGRR